MPDAARKLFVLDTNVLMHDPTSLFRFEEHDLFIPMMTLEELDANKKGLTEVARNARQASRMLDDIVSRAGIHADIFLVDVLLVDGLGDQSAERCEHEPAHLRIDRDIAHSCRNENALELLSYALTYNHDVIFCILRSVADSDAAREVYECKFNV